MYIPLDILCCDCRQPDRAAEFETTSPGAGGWKRRPEVDSSSSQCGAELLPSSLQAIIQTGGTTNNHSERSHKLTKYSQKLHLIRNYIISSLTVEIRYPLPVRDCAADLSLMSLPVWLHQFTSSQCVFEGEVIIFDLVSVILDIFDWQSRWAKTSFLFVSSSDWFVEANELPVTVCGCLFQSVHVVFYSADKSQPVLLIMAATCCFVHVRSFLALSAGGLLPLAACH